MAPILEQILRRAEAGSLKGGHLLESQRAAAQLHFLPGCANAGHRRCRARSRQFAEMVFAHYRELCTESEAAEWFGIVPATAEARNIVQMTV